MKQELLNINEENLSSFIDAYAESKKKDFQKTKKKNK